MDSGNQLVNYCQDCEYRVYCEVSDNLCIQRFYKNHLKSKTHTNNIKNGQNSIIFLSTLTERKQWSKYQLKLTLIVFKMKIKKSKEIWLNHFK